MGKSAFFPHFDRANQATDLILIKISGLISPITYENQFNQNIFISKKIIKN
jgi:hypothetical protein